MKTVLSLLAFCLSCAASPVAAQSAPDALVRATVEEVLAVLAQGGDRSSLQAVVEQKVLPHFDFRAMTQLALGRHWREATPAQQRALEQAFRGLLVRTYTVALSEAGRGERRVEVRPLTLKPGDNDATVRTQVREAGRAPISIDYRMTLSNGAWKVTDIAVENASLVISYRGSFASEIARSGIDGLIKLLEERNRQGGTA
jgi:phospholipid transport system substrate-binding protein